MVAGLKGADLIHGPGYIIPGFTRRPAVVTVYDIIALKHPDLCKRSNVLHFKWNLPRSIQRAAAIIVLSNAVKEDLVKLMKVAPDKIEVIPPGIDECFNVPNEDTKRQVRERYKLPDRFVLFVGNIEPKKNLEMLIRTFFAVKMDKKLDHKLVIVGQKAWKYQQVFSLIESLNIEEQIIFTDYVPLADLPAVYALSECFAEVLPPDVFIPFDGPGALGSSLIEAGLDHLVFIGSVEVGRQVAALAGQNLTSVALELGGKDAAIVLPDADLDRTVEGIAWGSFSNCGQNCASIERVLVHEDVADEFVEKLVDRVGRLRVGGSEPEGSDVGPLRNEGQLRAVQRQLAAAVEGGARILCGGEPAGEGFGFQPTVLDDVTAEMDVWRVETFGPLLPLRRVASVDEAIAVANDCDYGLTNSLWTADLPRARDLATRLECGVVTVNNHSYTGAMPFAPWGGIKQTGLGSTNSHHALMEMVRPQVVVTDKPHGHEFFWYPYDGLNLELARVLRRFLTGGGGMFKVLGLIKRAARARDPEAGGGANG